MLIIGQVYTLLPTTYAWRATAHAIATEIRANLNFYSDEKHLMLLV
jgi:hypothetical protein